MPYLAKPIQGRALLISTVALFPPALVALVYYGLPHSLFVNYRMDSCLDMIGACSTLLLAMHLLYARIWYRNTPPQFQAAVASLLNVGILKAIKAWTDAPSANFWLDSSVVFLGALPFFTVLLPGKVRQKVAFSVSASTVVLTFVVGLTQLFFSDHWLPALDGYQFTLSSSIPRYLGALIYLCAAARLFSSSKGGQTEEFVFGLFTLFLGSVHFILPLVTLWGPSWWALQTFRPVPYLFALVALMPEYRKAAASLVQQEQQFRTLFEDSPAGKSIYGRHYDYRKVNRAFCEMLGYSEQEIVGMSALSLCHPEDLSRTLETGEKLFTGKTSHFKLEKRFRKKDGTYIWTSSVASIIRSGKANETLVLVVSTDITDRKKSDALRLEKELADSSSKSKSQFIASMSHEIRTPLAAVSGFVDILKLWPTSSRERETAFERIDLNMKILTEMIEDILDLAKIEAGKLEISGETTDLRRVVAEVLGALENAAKQKGLQLLSEFIEIPTTIQTDSKRLRQILLNLMSNAIKFTAEGHVRLVARKIHAKSDSAISIIVEDTGIGLSEEQSEHIFEPFVQADRNTFRKYGGTGLGLSISRHLARALGGDLKLQRSSPGLGSTFELLFDPALPGLSPLKSARRLSLAPAPAARTTLPERLTGKRLLVVEDSPDYRLFLTRFLAKAGAIVEEADDGVRALELVDERKYDAILLDMQMGTMDGDETFLELKRRKFPGPVIALSAQTREEERHRCLQMGFRDYLFKPVSVPILLQTLESALAIF